MKNDNKRSPLSLHLLYTHGYIYIYIPSLYKRYLLWLGRPPLCYLRWNLLWIPRQLFLLAGEGDPPQIQLQCYDRQLLLCCSRWSFLPTVFNCLLPAIHNLYYPEHHRWCCLPHQGNGSLFAVFFKFPSYARLGLAV